MDANQLGLLVKLLNPSIEEKIRFLITDSTLADREKEVVLKRWFHGMNLEEVGREYGVTRERIRQIEAKAFRKLRKRPIQTFYELFPIQDVNRLKELLEVLLERLNEKPEPLYDESDVLKMMPIDDLELSVRSYHGLKRAGVRTVYDLSKLRQSELLEIRNMGRKSYEEVVNKMTTIPNFKWREENDE